MKVRDSTPQGRPRIEEVVERMENSRNLVRDGKNDEVELEDRALDAVFEAPRWTQEEEEAAKATAAAQAVNRLVRASAELDEDVERRKRPRWCHRKRKLEEEAKQQEENAKRQKQDEDEWKPATKTCVKWRRKVLWMSEKKKWIVKVEGELEDGGLMDERQKKGID